MCVGAVGNREEVVVLMEVASIASGVTSCSRGPGGGGGCRLGLVGSWLAPEAGSHGQCVFPSPTQSGPTLLASGGGVPSRLR